MVKCSNTLASALEASRNFRWHCIILFPRNSLSPRARAPKFVGALKVVPKLVASDQKIGRSWMLDICRVEDWIGNGYCIITAMILHHTFFLETGFSFTSISSLSTQLRLPTKCCVHYRGSDKTEEGSRKLSLYRSVRAGTRALIKHGEITALEDL